MTRLGIDIEPMGIQQIYLDNLKRLRLIDWTDRPEGRQFVRTLDDLMEPPLRITAFGGAFIDACTSPKKKAITA